MIKFEQVDGVTIPGLVLFVLIAYLLGVAVTKRTFRKVYRLPDVSRVTLFGLEAKTRQSSNQRHVVKREPMQGGATLVTYSDGTTVLEGV